MDKQYEFLRAITIFPGSIECEHEVRCDKPEITEGIGFSIKKVCIHCYKAEVELYKEIKKEKGGDIYGHSKTGRSKKSDL